MRSEKTAGTRSSSSSILSYYRMEHAIIVIQIKKARSRTEKLDIMYRAVDRKRSPQSMNETVEDGKRSGTKLVTRDDLRLRVSAVLLAGRDIYRSTL